MIGPGIPNPLMLGGGGDPLDELGKIERSVRFRRVASAEMSRAFAGAPTSAKKRTYCFWVKRGMLGAAQHITSASTGGGAAEKIYFRSDDCWQLEGFDSIQGVGLVSSNVQRDPGAHCMVTVSADTTQATASDRLKIWIGNEQITAFSANNYPTLNSDLQFAANGITSYIGRVYAGGSNFDGEISFFSFVDGQDLTPAAFGQIHPRTGQWRPKSKAAIRAAVAAGGGARNGWGANGFFLPFDDVTSLTTLGYDRSQSDTDTTGNNWTATNISLSAGVTYDSMLDTPTNNFCTLNPLDKGSSIILSDGNLKAASSGWNVVRCTFPISKGLWYFEGMTEGGTGNNMYGVATSAAALNSVGGESGMWAIINDAGVYKKANNGAYTALAGLPAPNPATDALRVAVNADTKKIWFGVNDSWSGDPVAGTGEAFTLPDDVFMPAVSLTATYTSALNFGQRQFSRTPPAGFKALCTKNLPYPKIQKSESAFVARTDSGANIVATLAAAAPFADWIKIYKRRDPAEGWRWEFSDDSGNYLDSSSTAAKAAFPALGGASYVGYALKVSAQNGVATGRLTHTNGSVSVVADGLANSRKVVMLRNEAGGNWFFYHPDLTAGKLLYLNLQSAETTDATISSVTASGFTVAAALASGTYRWISISEIDGFSKVLKHVGNAASDGPFSSCGHFPALFMVKNRDAAQTWLEWDNVRDKGNPEVTQIYPNQTAGELIDSVNNLCDFVSNGIKYRGASAPGNGSGNTVVGITFAAFPFRYANAR